MDIENLNKQKREGGFTLVELAIVMIIIGLLIGGILKGQELIANSQVTATVAQIKGIDAAVSTFRDKYSALPGDMSNPEDRLACTDDCVTGGDADGRIAQGDGTPGAAPANDEEGVMAFSHLASADLISGVTSDDIDLPDDPEFGNNIPEAKVGGGYWMGYSDGSLTDVDAGATVRKGHYLVLNGLVDAVSEDSGNLTASRASQIDRKLDDGSPASGSVLSNDGDSCIADGAYDESNDVSGCAIYIRVQG